MKIVKASIVALSMSVAASGASAATLGWDGYAGSANVQVNSNPVPGTDVYNGTGGSFKMTDATNAPGLRNSFIVFCLDLVCTIQTGQDYVINNVNPFQTQRVLSAL